MILKVLNRIGANFDCASMGEIEQILSLGVSPDRIIFANTTKNIKSLEYAHKTGVDFMTCDSELELIKIKKHHPNAKVLLRLKVDNKDAVWDFSYRFGCDMDSCRDLIDLACQIKVNLVGVAFHIGPTTTMKSKYGEEIRKSRELFDYARAKHGVDMFVLDIGGGYPGYEMDEKKFELIANDINKSLDIHFPRE